MSFKNYEEWESNQGLSPSSPESYYAELAFKAAIEEAMKIVNAAALTENTPSEVAVLALTELEAIKPDL